MIHTLIGATIHTDNLAAKLAHAIGMLSKIRHYVPDNTLCAIYDGMFSAIITYGSQIWGQFENKNINHIIKLQNKAIRIIKQQNCIKIQTYLTFGDNIKLLNFMYIHQSMKENLPPILNNNFTYLHNLHAHNTRGSSRCQELLPKINTHI